MHNKIIMLIISILTIEGLCAQNVNKINFPRYAENTRMEMRIPNQINGFITLKGDLHTHTYFSDGSVSPDMRVDEAWKTGLDVLAITDHILSIKLIANTLQEMKIHLIIWLKNVL